MVRRRGAVIAVLAICVSAAAAARHGYGPHRTASGRSVEAQNAASERPPEGLRFRLSDAEATVAPPARVATASSVPLDDRQAQALLDRLPPLAPPSSGEQPFALRDKSLPPPRTGKVVADSFPPPSSSGPRPAVPTGPLTVLRHSPDGDVSLAPNLSVTFSQPMVAVASHGELAQSAVPVHMTPQPAGAWRWLGTQTLVFETPSRLPMATDYEVEVPAGTTSATGATLEKAERWMFSTPPPTLLVSRPADAPTRFDPLFFAAFDQKIDPAAVLGTIRVEAGSAVPRLRLASEREIAADQDVAKLAKEAPAGNWIAFGAEEPLPSDTRVTVTVAAGTPSAEGPKKTAAAQQWQFRTYGPMRTTDHGCAVRGCPPSSAWQISFSNPLDPETVADDIVRVEPALRDLRVSGYGNRLVIGGQASGSTKYRVTIFTRLHDRFGQALQKEESVTFETGVAPPSLTSRAAGNFVVLDPAAPPRFPVYSVNHESIHVQVRAVQLSDWLAFGEALASPRPFTAGVLPGRMVLDEEVAVKGRPDELTETDIDLARVLPGGLGQVVLFIEPGKQVETPRARPIRVWVQATRIGLDAFTDGDQLVAWASSLDTGAPLAQVQLSMLPNGETATTGADGIARLRIGGQARSLLVARLGKDIAILPPYPYPYPGGSQWQRLTVRDRLSWYVFDDRRLYRPGEEVHVKGWIRIVTGGPAGDVTPVKDAVRTVSYTLRDSRRNEIGKGSATVNAFGGFDFVVKLPVNMNLGSGELQLESNASAFPYEPSYRHTFQVQEFRRPEYEVTTRASEGPYIVGGYATIRASASYYAGGGLPNANIAWDAYSFPGSFTPPNRSDFTFGTGTLWWDYSYAPRGGTRSERHEAVTDATGTHVLRIDFDAVNPPRPTNITVTASVTDVNRQSWSSTVNLLVHPSAAYVGLKTERYFVDRGQPLPVDLIVTDLDGRAVAGRPVQVRAERIDWRQERGTWQEKVLDTQECTVTSAAEPSRCTFRTPEGGTYRVTATVADEAGRPNETQIRRWVSGGMITQRPDVSQQRVTLIPDKEEYRAGDVAQILVAAPFYPAEALMTLRRSGLVRAERFTLVSPSYTIRIPIDERWTPNVRVQVDLVGATDRTVPAGQPAKRPPKQPAFASGSLDLRVPPADRALALTVAPRARALEPGGETQMDVTLRDAAGKPVAGAEVAVVVVDEAILSLTNYKLPDPVQWFYREREPGVTDHHLRSSVLLASPLALGAIGQTQTAVGSAVAFRAGVDLTETVEVTGAAPLVGGRGGGAAAQPISMRTDFSPLALFAASVPTDASGRAEVRVKLPDNLTRYRVMAVAATEGAKFGSGESTITARLPLMVRASAPRFLNVGDRVEFPIVLQNQTDTPLAVDVAMRASNAELPAGRGQHVSVPANDRVEVRFPVAASRPGTARFQVAAASGRWSDASEVSLPVWTPATTEAFATYGQIDQGAIVQRVKAPADAFTEFGGLEIGTSSTALQALTDAVVYLVTYPFDCAEQLSSRVLAVAALKDVLTAFSARGLPDPDKLAAGVNRDLERLAGLQNDDGGFALWRRGDESWPYVSIHVAHALERAKSKGFTVPDKTLQRSRDYLRNVEQHIPASYSDDARRALVAYALYVRSLGGDADRGRARSLIREAGLEKLSFEAIGWLLSGLSGDTGSAGEVAAVRTYLNNHVTETAGAAHFAVSYRDGAHLLFQSDRRADGVILDALITDQPKSDLIPKIVDGLLAYRTAGRWENTQENAFILLALDRYFETYEKVTPDFVARAWLGDRYAGEQAFKGRTTERHVVQVPMKALADAKGATDLIVSKEGAGRLYYRIGLQYAPRDLNLTPMDRGFTVERSYEAIDDAADVQRDKDGTWHIRAGARVRVRLSMVAPARRYHVALVDPLPAGLEILNPALAIAAPIPPDTRPNTAGAGSAPVRWFWIRPWFEHQNLRDDRAEAFASLLWEGVHTYSYVARATTPGQFIVPPPRAEEMYHPETFGRGATDRVVVEMR